MIVATMTMLVTLLIYMVAKGFFDRIFIKEEVSQTERLSEYTAIVSQSLRLTEILNALVNVIGNTPAHKEDLYLHQGFPGELSGCIQQQSPG